MILFKSPIVVLDTETTGFPRDDWSRVIELAGVLLDTDGTEISTWAQLVRPDVLDARANGALAINGITREMLVDALTTEAAADSFRRWLALNGSPFATAFNVDFDRPMTARMGIELRWANCVMLKAMEFMGPAGALPEGRYGGWKWPKLSEAASFFGVQVEGDAHRALTDARMAAGIACAIRRGEAARGAA